jgi:hypothetical protein
MPNTGKIRSGPGIYRIIYPLRGRYGTVSPQAMTYWLSGFRPADNNPVNPVNPVKWVIKEKGF